MSRTWHPDSRLPVTGEIGSEGGSYADRTNQSATFTGPANPPDNSARGNMAVAAEAAARSPLAGTSGDTGADTASGMIRYPTEPPSPADARQGRRIAHHPWRAGLIAVAAGTAALIGISRLRRRS